jgi:SHS2 domain-containing protein
MDGFKGPMPETAMPSWEHYSHGADIGVRGFGRSAEEAFEQAALALTAVVADVSSIRQLEQVEVHCEAPDLELLLVSWLNAIIYEMAVRNMLFESYNVKLSGLSLTGTLTGEAVDTERHELAVEPKGATVTDLKVEHESGGRWRAQCIVDV